ncbi:hypothetical protein AX289_25460 [Methylorubrum populi]|nr:hypothetical protein AX289_25460 [Methylorubrum populi]
MLMDVIKQGARARALGRPRDACPHPADSRERRAWYEGYDGSTWDFADRVPHPAVAPRGPASRDAVAGSVHA